jgi:hypothetical protein
MSHTLAHDQLLVGGRSISRRDFVRGIGFALVGGALLAIGGRLVAPSRVPEVPGETLMRSMFAALLGQTFEVYQEAAPMPALRLAKVRDLPAAAHEGAPVPAGDQRERNFSLLFSRPIGQMIEQGTYRFEYLRLGSFSLFIVPMAPEPNATYYEAIFNRL